MTTGSPLTVAQINRFRKTVYGCFGAPPRSFPWRRRITPYRVFVAEIMLQQTTVGRVAEKFPPFVRRFPSFRSLSVADTKSLLTAWQGLGYNRRALNLHRAAFQISRHHAGRLPRTQEGLIALPGVGPATAAAIRVYAFNQPAVYIETNIRALYLHHFFPDEENVADTQLLPYIAATLHTAAPARWYSALMDYGTALKKREGNAARRSKSHVRQPPFAGSLREARGSALRLLLAAASPLPLGALAAAGKIDKERMALALASLVKEKVVNKQGNRFAIIG